MKIKKSQSKEPMKKKTSNGNRQESLAPALDDGQEVKMFKLMGAGRGYCVTIHGDCYCESKSKETLEEAVKEAAQKYAKWLEKTE
jgi:hypothetical protein